VRRAVQAFWDWYERHYTLNIAIAAGLFVLQLLHLTWLSGEVLADRITGDPAFSVDGFLQWLIVVVDYTEIPALVSVSLVYVNELRKGFSWKSAAYLVFLNSQWLHIFWITDEFVVGEFGQGGAEATSLPTWLAYVAILIDYLELPVIYDTMKKLVVSVRERQLATFLREDLR
jgi:hypothetical protein